jgi:hypothetical protein
MVIAPSFVRNLRLSATTTASTWWLSSASWKNLACPWKRLIQVKRRSPASKDDCSKPAAPECFRLFSQTFRCQVSTGTRLQNALTWLRSTSKHRSRKNSATSDTNARTRCRFSQWPHLVTLISRSEPKMWVLGQFYKSLSTRLHWSRFYSHSGPI